MKVLRSLALCAALGASLPASAAVVFNFLWSGDPALDSTIVSSDDATLLATGTITVNRAAGQAFTSADVTAVSISVTGDDIADFVLTSLGFINGLVAVDGLSATITDLFGSDGANIFGCDSLSGDCGPTGAGNVVVGIFGGTVGIPQTGRQFVAYTSADAAQASFKLTAQSIVAQVPVPATLPLALLSLGLLAGLRYRSAQAA